MAAQVRHTLAANAELSAGLGPGVDLELSHSEKARDGKLRPQRCLGKADGDLTVEVVAVPREKRMLLDGDDDIQVAPIPPMRPGLALALKLQAHPRFHAGRNLHRQGPIGSGPPGASTVPASLFNDTPFASAGRAGLTDREKALRV